MIRFAFTPLYLGEAEVRAAVDIIEEVMTKRLWDAPEYHRKAAVT
jgi:kynureninase